MSMATYTKSETHEMSTAHFPRFVDELNQPKRKENTLELAKRIRAMRSKKKGKQ